MLEEVDVPAVSALGVRSRKLRNVLKGQSRMGDQIFFYFELLRASEGTLSCWSRQHLQSLASTPVSRRVDVRQAA
jgi:predicted RNA-binding protein with PUA-like domain